MTTKEFMKTKEILDMQRPNKLNKMNSIAITQNSSNFGLSLSKKTQKGFYNSISKFSNNSSNLECNMKNFLNNYDELLENLTCLKKSNSNEIKEEKNKLKKSPIQINLEHRKSAFLESEFNYCNNILGLTQSKNIPNNNHIYLKQAQKIKMDNRLSKSTQSKKSSSSIFLLIPDIFSMISNVDKKVDTPKNNNPDIVKSFINTEEIKDFYEYTCECLKRVSLLKKPSKSEIEALYLDLPINKKELKSKD
jgi:hypothetical protein